MIPTSIDGTDITGATIDGTDVQEITVDGDVVFSAVTPVIDDFETGNLNSYTTLSSGLAVTTTNPFEGSFCLSGDGSIITSTGPNNSVPEFGTDFEFYVLSTQLSGQGVVTWESDGNSSSFGFRTGYVTQLDFNSDRFTINKAVSGDINGAGRVRVTNLGLNTNTWYNIQLTFSGSTLNFEIINTSNSNTIATGSTSQYNSPGNQMSLRSNDSSISMDFIAPL